MFFLLFDRALFAILNSLTANINIYIILMYGGELFSVHYILFIYMVVVGGCSNVNDIST